MPLPLGAISLAIDINQKLATINPKLNGMINQSQIKGDNPLPDYQTGNDYSFEVSGKDLAVSILTKVYFFSLD